MVELMLHASYDFAIAKGLCMCIPRHVLRHIQLILSHSVCVKHMDPATEQSVPQYVYPLATEHAIYFLQPDLCARVFTSG